MPSFLTNPLALRVLYTAAMARAFLRYRNPRRRAAGRHQTAFYERAWRDAAAELGATYTALGSDIAEIELDGVRTRVMDNTTEIDGPVTLAVLSDKLLTYRVLQQDGIRVSRHQPFSLKDLSPALTFMRNSYRDCVVKPVAGTGGGRGVTTGITTPAQLAQAAAIAAVYCDDLMIEEQIDGDNYRLLYLDGELVDAFRRRPATVIGDGRSSVSKLLNDANNDRLKHGSGKSQVLITADLDMKRTLAKQNRTLRSVPADGQAVILKTVVNENAGADNTTAMRDLCDSIVEDGARACRALGVRFAGVDIITKDPSVPLHQSGGVMLEVNAPPNFYYHYHKADGSYPVALHLLKRLLVQRERTDATLELGTTLS
jgi:cyanophycin synthetase